MSHKRMLRFGAAGALGMGLCACGAALAINSTPSSENADNASDNKKKQINLGFASAENSLPPKTNPKTRDTRPGSAQITPWKQVKIQPGDTLAQIFKRSGIPVSQWQQIMDSHDEAQPLRHIHPGDKINLRKTTDGDLAELRYQFNAVKTLHIMRQHDDFKVQVNKKPTTTRTITARGSVSDSLSKAMTSNDIPEDLAQQVEDIFNYRLSGEDSDKVDKFAVIYDATYHKNERVSTGSLRAASIHIDGHEYRAFRAKDSHGQYAYFDEHGKAVDDGQSFLRKPVSYTRISSRFNPNRINPVTHRRMPHKGVDLAAPAGTDVRATAQGTVEFAGWLSGYGRIIKIKNANGYSTRFAHLQHINQGISPGQSVKKGQVIGRVGMSGRATGPHLHYEIRKDGTPKDPMKMDLPKGHIIPEGRLASYREDIKPMLAQLSSVPKTLLAQSDQHKGSQHDGCETRMSSSDSLTLDPIGAQKYPRHSEHILCLSPQKDNNA